MPSQLFITIGRFTIPASSPVRLIREMPGE
jgi:hypothetical protein